MMENFPQRVKRAVTHFWLTRRRQADRQRSTGRKDQGARSAVTGGAQMDGFVGLITDLILEAGVDESHVFRKKCLDLPGFFRPTKQWDLLVVRDGQLVVALEVKSQVGPSFGNNFNNRTEEAMGSALDLWTAYREGAFNKTVRPWLGYLFLLEDCEKSRCPVRVQEPHFEVFSEFKDASYMKRYEIFCRKLVRERHYDAATLVLSPRDAGLAGRYSQPSSELSVERFVAALAGHIAAYIE